MFDWEELVTERDCSSNCLSFTIERIYFLHCLKPKQLTFTKQIPMSQQIELIITQT
jgi:hypothetical protein